MTFSRKLSLFVVVSLGLFIAQGSEATEGVRIQTFKDHSRVVIKVDQSVPIDWKNLGKKFEIILKGINLGDLGAPLGEERRWLAQFKDIDEPRISSLTLVESAEGVKIEGVWKFPSGPLAPAHPQMETFEYRDKGAQAGAQFVVDFWVKKGPTVTQVKAAQMEARKQAELKRTEAEARQRADRRLASEKRRQEIETAAVQFCKEPLSEKNDIFLPFYPFHEKVDLSRYFSSRMPDERFNYYLPVGKSEEHQYIRLVLRLYKEGKSALALRTLDFFTQQYPISNFRHEMKLLKASALVKLGHVAEAERILQTLVAEAPETPVALQSGIYLAAKQFEKGAPLAALESFMWLIGHYPDHGLAWIFHLGAAESLLAMKQTERAAKEYQWIVENAPDDKARIEGAARIGDLYLDRFHYEQALASYYQALTHFPNESKNFPSIYINRAEALYMLGQYDRAKDAFEDFIDRYGAHPAGWRAAFRLGEIHSRRTTQGSMEAGRKWYYETINRYPLSPGATLARLRLIPCGDQGGFDWIAMRRFFKEDAINFTKANEKGEVAAKNYRDFRALSEVRSLITFGKEDQAVGLALEEMKTNAMGESRPFLAKTISALFRKTILKYLAQGQKYEAVAFFKDKKDLLSRDSSPSELDYLLKLSQAASDLGLSDMGKELVEIYEKAAAKQSPERKLAAAVEDDLEVLLRESEKNYSKARAIWTTAALKPTPEIKKEVREILAQVREQSPYSFEKEMILGVIDEMDSQFASAIQHVTRAQILKPNSDDLRVEAWLAALNSKNGDHKMALSLYKDAEKKLQLRIAEEKKKRAPATTTPAPDTLAILGVPSLPALEQLLLAQGEVLEKLGMWGEAAAAYGRMIEKNWGGNRALYSYARSLMKTGKEADVKAAVAAFEKVAASKENDFWKKLAVEGLANQKSEQSIRNAKEGAK